MVVATIEKLTLASFVPCLQALSAVDRKMKWSAYQRELIALNATHTCTESQMTSAGEEGHEMDMDENGETSVGRAKACGNEAGKATEAGMIKCGFPK